MKVYEVIIDYDCTTRSTGGSEGLFSTREKAETFIKSKSLKDWQYSQIKIRNVR